MADNNNIKEFTATDIEKYWSGQLSKAEMHDLERAAMDDPFLADALEGYANATNVSDDIGSLKEKIDARVGATPVVNLKKKRVFWLRVAAAIIIIGASVSVNLEAKFYITAGSIPGTDIIRYHDIIGNISIIITPTYFRFFQFCAVFSCYTGYQLPVLCGDLFPCFFIFF